jgi:hypothetical protein
MTDQYSGLTHCTYQWYIPSYIDSLKVHKQKQRPITTSIYKGQTQQYLHAPFIILQHISAMHAGHHQVEVLQKHKRKVSTGVEASPLQLKL